MITIENIETGAVFEGQEIEYFLDDENMIGEQITIKDLNGRDVMQLIPNNERSSFDVSELSSGLYLLTSPKFTDVLRLVIQ